ncbi:ribonuclease 3, partial [Quercus suber]
LNEFSLTGVLGALFDAREGEQVHGIGIKNLRWLTEILAVEVTGRISFCLGCELSLWPGAYCDSKHSCCYPETGKPVTDFTIGGLWPE